MALITTNLSTFPKHIKLKETPQSSGMIKSSNKPTE